MNELAILASIGIFAGLCLFFRGFRLLARKRLLLNTPTSKIRSASMGLVEASGFAVGPYTMPAPITGQPCYLYRTTAWQRRDSNRNHDWEKVVEETMYLPFFLDDHTGQLLVKPAGVELDLHRDFREEFSVSFFPVQNDVPPRVSDFLRRHGLTSASRIRIEECCIHPQDFLFAIGTLAENSALEARPLPPPIPDAGEPLTAGRIWERLSPSTPVAEVVRLSGPTTPASPGEITQQSKIAAALTKAGIQNPAAWEAAGVASPGSAVQQAPQLTEISVKGKRSSPKPDQPSGFDLNPPVALMKGQNNPAFLISWRSQSEIASSLAWKSAAMIWGGAALTLIGLYVLLAQMELL